MIKLGPPRLSASAIIITGQLCCSPADSLDSVCKQLLCFISVSSRLLFLRLTAQNEKDEFAFCSVKGCERIKIKAVIPKGSGPSDCTAQAYPRYAEMPIVDVPMPRKLSASKLVSD